MAEVKKQSDLVEIKDGVYRFADSHDAESRIRHQLAELYRQNLELWRQIGHGTPKLWRDTESLIRWLENGGE
ncbi:MAG: hypothetical protein N3B10_09975 [Armatimonadetes bacterium]|nr:hypothetical protein [Armatimonadota bacterium]MCS7263257.1 hypothetical protein [Armatimonadota bacterium]MCX7968794.1 hypothetical protein [Armatimonadota bacterium]MDW8026962.1 hypothetical protein [Armatimonadota bacterium]MDW8144362.1 hypothetical protein [Armatimonadota bacterium]